MSSEKRSRVFGLHSFIGLFLAFVIYTVCFTGTFSLFHGELTYWENKEVPTDYSGTPAPIDKGFEEFLATIPETSGIALSVVTYPTQHKPFYELEALELVDGKGPPVPKAAYYSAITGDKMSGAGITLSEWMAHFHTDLWLPAPYGRGIIGLTGFFLLVMVISGIFMHKSPVKMSFLWRPDKSLKVLLMDTHNVFGLWGLLFHAVTAFTGAILGLLGMLGIIYGFMTYDNRHAAHIEPFDEPFLEGTGAAAPSINPDRVQEITKNTTGSDAGILLLFNRGKDNAVYRVYYEVEKPMVRFGILDLEGATGNIVAHNPTPTNIIPRVFVSIMPLHTAAYGGIWLKIIYGVLGTSLCLTIITGLMMWVDRNSESKTRGVVERLSIGICTGLPVATFLSIYVDQLATFTPETKAFSLGASVFAIWAGTVVLAFAAPSAKAGLRALLILLAASLAGLPILHIITRSSEYLNTLGQGTISPTMANVVFLLLALLLGAAARKIPKDQSA